MQIEPRVERLDDGRSPGGLVRTFVPPETMKAVAALLEPGTQAGAWTLDAMGFSLLCPQISGP